MKPKNITVIGSRGFTDQELMNKHLEKYLESIKLLISGGASGVDKLAKSWAKNNNIPTKIFLPDFKKSGVNSYFIRNRLIVDAADLLIAFWDSRSRGMAFTVKYARYMDKKVRVIKYLEKNNAVE